MKPDKCAAARKAIEAYEKAVAAAQQALLDGPPTGLGATIMREKPYGVHGLGKGNYVCSECGKDRNSTGWKFCPHCGCEIVRFDKYVDPNVKDYSVSIVIEKQKSVPMLLPTLQARPKR
jgi:hypothetical protein